MTAAPVDVIGSAPISFTNSDGAQKFVPLSALQLNGSILELKTAWASAFDPAEKTTLLALATARAAAGELNPPPVPPPRPGISLSAKHAGPEGNGIVVTTTVEAGAPLVAKISLKAVQTNVYAGLATAKAAALAIGVDTPTGTAGDPLKGTGVVVVKQSSINAATDLPKVVAPTVLAAAGLDVKSADDSKVLFKLLPAADYAGSGGLSVAVALDASGTTFTVTVVYDSSKETGTNTKVTLQTLDQLPAQVAYLVKAEAPQSGAALPPLGSTTTTLTGGAPGLTANGLLYTS